MTRLVFSFTLPCHPAWKWGNFGLIKYKIAWNCPTYMLDFIVMQMSRVNLQKSFFALGKASFTRRFCNFLPTQLTWETWNIKPCIKKVRLPISCDLFSAFKHGMKHGVNKRLQSNLSKEEILSDNPLIWNESFLQES